MPPAVARSGDAEREQQRAPVGRPIGRERNDGAPERCDRGIVVGDAELQRAEIAVRLRQARIELDRSVVGGDRGIELPLSRAQAAQAVVGDRRRRLGGQHRLDLSRRARDVAFVQQRIAEIQPGVDKPGVQGDRLSQIDQSLGAASRRPEREPVQMVCARPARIDGDRARCINQSAAAACPPRRARSAPKVSAEA